MRHHNAVNSTRVTLNAEIPAAAWISLRAKCWDRNSRDRETVYVYKYMQMMETMKQSGLWSSLGTHGSGGCMVVMYFQWY